MPSPIAIESGLVAEPDLRVFRGYSSHNFFPGQSLHKDDLEWVIVASKTEQVIGQSHPTLLHLVALRFLDYSPNGEMLSTDTCLLPYLRQEGANLGIWRH